MTRFWVSVFAICLGAAALCCSRPSPGKDAGAPLPSSSALAKPASSAPRTVPESERTGQKGYVRMTVGGVAHTDRGSSVVLVDSGRRRALPILVGESEALSIELRLNGRKFPRPLTHDLFDNALEQLDAQVDNVRVDSLINNTFHGTVELVKGARRMELDARSSDAIALALGSGAPIHVAEEVLERVGVSLHSLGELPLRDGGAAPEDLPGRAPVEL